ncbi:hypothetical protein PI124_g4880 [Phytophthora idaei]|nr:hypothetical protein PI126_g18600 [Phytophthora idaei]KAG3250460.1 hypothetical protein PI124_g4880 [Phytophthora idaei]
MASSDVFTEMIGRFADYLLLDDNIGYNGARNYLSYMTVQLESKTKPHLFADNSAWYTSLHSSLKEEFDDALPDDGTTLFSRAPLMPSDDLRFIGKIPASNTAVPLADRTLMNFQWAVLGRSSDIVRPRFSDMQWVDGSVLLSIRRAKISEEQTLAITCSELMWEIDPLNSLAIQIVSDAYNTSSRVFPQVQGDASTGYGAQYINELLKTMFI